MVSGIWYLVDNQPNEKAAVDEDLTLQVSRIDFYKEFQVKINEKPKFQIEEVSVY